MRANLRDICQERFTGIDRRLLRSIDADGLVSPHHLDSIEQSLRAGRHGRRVERRNHRVCSLKRFRASAPGASQTRCRLGCPTSARRKQQSRIVRRIRGDRAHRGAGCDL